MGRGAGRGNHRMDGCRPSGADRAGGEKGRGAVGDPELREKVRRLDVGTERSLRTVLIHSGSLSKGIQEDDYIDYTISLESLLAGD